jgi:hypothetical protein
VNLVLRAPALTSVYIALPQGPTNHIRLNAPNHDADQGLDRVVEIKLTVPTSQRYVVLIGYTIAVMQCHSSQLMLTGAEEVANEEIKLAEGHVVSKFIIARRFPKTSDEKELENGS